MGDCKGDSLLHLWMFFWELAFVLLALSSIAGMVLFFGYTFRIRIHYPMTLVITHLVMTAVMCLLYLICIVWKLSTYTNESWLFPVILVSSGVMMILTFIVGLAFFFKFNLKGIALAKHFISLHVTMASVTFILLIASTIFVTQSQLDHKHNFPASNYNYYKHLHMRQRTNSQ